MLQLLPALLGALALPELTAGAASSAASYSVKTPPLTTDWTYKVGTDPWPEYPRPQLTREKWQSLNGIWSYRNASASDIEDIPSGDLGTAIMVPSCIESALSGVMAPLEPYGSVKHSWYQTTFDIPSDWNDDNVVINFGAVDWEATVFVNGKKAGHHLGGWTRFSLDITPHLKEGENELTVFVFDPTDSDDVVIPIGKQTLRPDHIFYTPCSGIWDSVFIEPVPKKNYIKDLQVDGNMHGELTIKAITSTGKSEPVSVTVHDKSGKKVGSGSGSSDEAFVTKVKKPALWSPDHPNLYDIKIKMGDDEVKAYTGFRTIERGKVDGVTRPLLNGEFYLAFGTLDQGWWPDGLMVPPNHEAMVFDLQMLKDLGFNMLRKHIKVESDLYYRACDEMGLLVIQDMPAMRPLQGIWPSQEEYEEFGRQLVKLVETHRSFPSIYTWVIYNEGWGQPDGTSPEVPLAPMVKELDPTRLVNAVSGWHDHGAGDYVDNHHYSMPQCGTPFYSIASVPYDPERIGFQGEFGGVAHNTSFEHIWNVEKSVNQINMTYEIDYTIPIWNERAHKILDELRDQIQRYACSGGVYTQTTDVEGEMNGLITYDRRLRRYDEKQWKADIQAMYDAAASRGGAKIGHRSTLGHAIMQTKEWMSGLWGARGAVGYVTGL